jgi:hypothetical protein
MGFEGGKMSVTRQIQAAGSGGTPDGFSQPCAHRL